MWELNYLCLIAILETSACSVVVIVVGNGHGEMSSNPGRG